MKKLGVATILLCAFAALAEVTVSAPVKKASVFVDKFIANEGCRITAGGIQVLHDRIVGNIVSSRKYEVVERENLAKVQKELKLVDSGMTEGNAPESNRLKAAGYCIYGKIIQYRDYEDEATNGGLRVRWLCGTVELQIRIVNITNGRELAAKTVKKEGKRGLTNAISTSQDLRLEVMSDLIDKAAKAVVAQLNDVAFPVYVLSANNRFVTGNITAEQVVEGEVWEVFVLGDVLKDPQTGDVLGQDEDLIAKVRVSRPGPKMTKFEYFGEVDKKSILAAKEDGEKMIMRLAPETIQDVKDGAVKPVLATKPSLSSLECF